MFIVKHGFLYDTYNPISRFIDIINLPLELCLNFNIFYHTALQRTGEDLNLKAADMWSFAVVLWEMSTREVPFADMSPMEIGMKV